jgi:hypothetical protein
MNGRLERMAPLTGVATVACTIIALLIFGSMPSYVTDSPDKIATWFNDDSGRILTGAWFDMLGGLFALWFAAVLRSWLVAHEGVPGRLSNLAFGGIVAAQACFWIADGILVGLASRANEDGIVNSPTSAATMFDVSGMLVFVAGAMAIATALAAVAVVAFRHAAMPQWLGYSAAVLALVCVVPFTSWIGLLASNVWVVAASAWLYRAMAPVAARRPPGVTPPPPAPAAPA